MTAVAGPPAAAVTDPGRPRWRSAREIFRTAGSVALAAAIFGFAVPHFASYRSTWASMHAMTWAQALLVAARRHNQHDLYLDHDLLGTAINTAA
jgi:hypothetical protein